MSLGTVLRTQDGTWQPEHGLYGEYGISPRLTLGLEVNENAGQAGQAGHILMFARVPVAGVLQKGKLAFELGIGANHRGGNWDGMVKTTLSAGGNFKTRWGPGWFNVDTALELRRPDTRPALKLDATLGLSQGLRLRPMVQFGSTYVPGKPLIWSVTPSLLIDTDNNATWVIGIERKTITRPVLGLKINLWRRF